MGVKMSNKIIYSSILLCLVFFTVVKGSCLEYGHSCWGAHGKRSGGQIIRPGSNIGNGEYNILDEGNANGGKPFQNFEDLSATASEHSPQSPAASGEERSSDITDASKLKNLLRNRNLKLRSRNNMEDSAEQQHRHAERWRRIPLFNLKTFGPSPLNTAENDLLQQLERRQATPPKASADEFMGVYYDFK